MVDFFFFGGGGEGLGRRGVAVSKNWETKKNDQSPSGFKKLRERACAP